MSTNNTDVQDMTETARVVFQAAHEIVAGMTDGSRKQIKELASEVSTVTGMAPKEVLGFVDHFVHKTQIAYVTRGKKGGLIKGSRPAKVVKPKRVKKDDDTVTSQ